MRVSRPAGATAGICLYLAGIFTFALNDALGKWLMASYTASQLMLLRSIGAAVILVPLAVGSGVSLRLSDQWRLHALRIACMAADTFCFYAATKFLPLADVMTFYLAAPLIITAISVPFLGESVGSFRWAAVLVGFVGVVVALRPSTAAISGASLIALLGACMFACAITITRRLRGTHWLPLILWQFVGAGLIGAVTSPIGWVTPTWSDVGLMAVLGILSMAAFIFLTKSLRLADASVIAPFTYSSIVWAVLLGWVIWGDLPNTNVAVGICIIIGSGLAVWAREQKRAAGTVTETVPVP